MSSLDQSLCQLMQMRIDSLLDGELEAVRKAELQAHLQQCTDCEAELAYAQRLHSAVRQLPALDCGPAGQQSLDRLLAVAGTTAKIDSPPGWLNRLWAGWQTFPLVLRYALPVVAVLVFAAGLGLGRMQGTGQEQEVPLAVRQEAAPSLDYSPEEIRQAMADLELALNYLESVSRRTSALVRDELLAERLGEALNVSTRIQNNDPQTMQDAGIDGPI